MGGGLDCEGEAGHVVVMAVGGVDIPTDGAVGLILGAAEGELAGGLLVLVGAVGVPEFEVVGVGGRL